MNHRQIRPTRKSLVQLFRPQMDPQAQHESIQAAVTKVKASKAVRNFASSVRTIGPPRDSICIVQAQASSWQPRPEHSATQYYAYTDGIYPESTTELTPFVSSVYRHSPGSLGGEVEDDAAERHCEGPNSPARGQDYLRMPSIPRLQSHTMVRNRGNTIQRGSSSMHNTFFATGGSLDGSFVTR